MTTEQQRASEDVCPPSAVAIWQCTVGTCRIYVCVGTQAEAEALCGELNGRGDTDTAGSEVTYAWRR